MEDTLSSVIMPLMDAAEITALGQSLRRIDQSLLNQMSAPEKERIWYQGGEPYFDIFIERRQDQVEWFQMTLRGRSLSWHRQGDRWQTGVTNELRTDDMAFYPASKLIESDLTPDPQLLELAIALCQSRPEEQPFRQLLPILQNADLHSFRRARSTVSPDEL
jgi:hypothetical protein